MLEELKTWDDDAWKRYKQTHYKVISLGAIQESNEDVISAFYKTFPEKKPKIND